MFRREYVLSRRRSEVVSFDSGHEFCLEIRGEFIERKWSVISSALVTRTRKCQYYDKAVVNSTPSVINVLFLLV